MEHDESLALGAKDDAVVNRSTGGSEIKETDQTRQLFLKLAGEDMVVDWSELKDVLDYALKNVVDNSTSASKKLLDNFLTATGRFLCSPLCKFEDPSTNNETGGRGFSKEACRTLIALVDADRSGKLEYREFIQLWSDVLEWRAAFTMHDSDHDGSLAGIELRQALNSAGYRLSSRLVNILMRRYGSDKHDKLMFDDFVVCALKLRTMIGIFKAKESKGNADKAEFGLEEWIETTLYA